MYETSCSHRLGGCSDPRRRSSFLERGKSEAMKKVIAFALTGVLLTGSAFALEVPSETVVQNLNGSQQVVKTYTLPPDADPQELIEEPFVLEGYLYTFADIVKTENPVNDTRVETETVTIETAKDDLSLILEQLAPTLSYDDGQYQGTLTLDHTTIHTEAAGYTTKSYTVTSTKTIGPVDRNDMSYVPATTVKDGRTLNLSNVEWQVTGTDLVGEALMPSSYQAVATYSGTASYRAATGYVTTADYVGEVSHSGIEDVTYQLTYLGEVDTSADSGIINKAISALSSIWPYLLGGAGIVAILVLSALLIRARRQLAQLREDQDSLPQHDEFEEEDADDETHETRA